MVKSRLSQWITFYQLAKEYRSKKPFISNKEETFNYKDFFLLCQKAKTALKPLQPGELLLCRIRSPVQFLSFLMASLDKGIHFFPAYEHLSQWEYEFLKKQRRPVSPIFK